MSQLPIVDATAFNAAALRVVAAHREVIAEAVKGIIWALHRDSLQDDGPAFDRLHDAAQQLNQALGQIDTATMQAEFAKALQ